MASWEDHELLSELTPTGDPGSLLCRGLCCSVPSSSHGHQGQPGVSQPFSITGSVCGPSLAVHTLQHRCGPGAPAPAPGEPIAQDGPYAWPEGAGWPVSPAHLQHPQPAACSCHLDPSQLGPTSSHLLLPEDPASAGLWSRGPCSHPTCPLPPLVFICFSGSSARVSAFPGFG